MHLEKPCKKILEKEDLLEYFHQKILTYMINFLGQQQIKIANNYRLKIISK